MENKMPSGPVQMELRFPSQRVTYSQLESERVDMARQKLLFILTYEHVATLKDLAEWYPNIGTRAFYDAAAELERENVLEIYDTHLTPLLMVYVRKDRVINFGPKKRRKTNQPSEIKSNRNGMPDSAFS